jgi:hypothetical protein
MTPERFSEIVKELQTKTTNVLTKKAMEYSRNGDRFHNFVVAGRRLGCDPIQALVGMKEKHSVSLVDMLEDLKDGKLPTIAMLDEKFGDEINYLILEYAMFRERIDVAAKGLGV